MKKIISLCVLCAILGNVFAQKETFDLVTFTPPKVWKKQLTESAIQFSHEDAAKGTYCLITLYKAVPGTANSKENFDLAWASLVKEMVTVSSAPEMQPSTIEDGWENQTGYAPFESNGNKGVVMLVTATAFGKMINLIILTNSDVYEKSIAAFLESINLKKPETIQQQAPGTNDNIAQHPAENSILGTWGATSSDNSNYRMKNGIMNYISRQYTFNADGSYSFVSKTFDPLMVNIILGKESGTYQISGTSLTITPKKSVLEAWSKKNGTDDWGKKINSQNRPLEKATYQFTKHYFSGIQVWNLVLQADKATQRDGPHSNNKTFDNAWYYGPLSANKPQIKLPGIDTYAKEEVQNQPALVSTGFAFTTTNFDDGWTSTVQEDWVQVTKRNTKVLLHYPNNKINAANTDVDVMCATAWNALVAPRYSNMENYQVTPGVIDYQRPYFAQADLTENISGKKLFVALFKKGNSGWIEIITTNKKSFIENFGLDISKIDYYADSKIWEPLLKLSNYNKFAVAATDLKGKWTNNFSGMTQYVNIYTGLDAGATAHSSSHVFEFGAGNTYKWSIAVASGVVGNLKFDGAKSNGKFSVPSNWQVYFSEIELKAKTYNAYFSCIKNARILWLEDTSYPTGYTGYGKKE
ncbi:MAG: lipocalin family protein [Chitinophagaceae bacterium]|nr:lipocalin family protein [Chitinophagaceae bacterium]